MQNSFLENSLPRKSRVVRPIRQNVSDTSHLPAQESARFPFGVSMTLGFAMAVWPEGQDPLVGVVADSRLMRDGTTLSDAGIKTYELGGRSAAVAAGHALPALTSSEIVRPFVENHNRNNEKPLGFYDTVRLFAFFLRRLSSQDTQAKCQVVVAGFLESGRPCLAYVVASRDVNRVRFFSVEEGGNFIIPVGRSEAGTLLLQGLAAARIERRPIFATGISLVWYMCRHPGAFSSVGGGLSVGSAEVGHTHFSWLHVQVEGRRFLRGMDVTECVRPSWPLPAIVEYDESWCAQLDRRVNQDIGSFHNPESVLGGGYDIDTLSDPETLFQTRDDPIAFDRGLARAG